MPPRSPPNVTVAPGPMGRGAGGGRSGFLSLGVQEDSLRGRQNARLDATESGAMLTRNNVTGTRTVLEFAREHDLAVLINRPLRTGCGIRTTWTTRSARYAARRSMSTFTCTRLSTTCNQKAPMVTQGNIAPDFTVETDRSEKVTLSKLRGRQVVLFHPKDDAPGWKIECKAR